MAVIAVLLGVGCVALGARGIHRADRRLQLRARHRAAVRRYERERRHTRGPWRGVGHACWATSALFGASATPGLRADTARVAIRDGFEAMRRAKPFPASTLALLESEVESIGRLRDAASCTTVGRRYSFPASQALPEYLPVVRGEQLVLLEGYRGSAPDCLRSATDVIRNAQALVPGGGLIAHMQLVSLVDWSRRTLLSCAPRATADELRRGSRDLRVLALDEPSFAETMRFEMLFGFLGLNASAPGSVGPFDASDLEWWLGGYDPLQRMDAILAEERMWRGRRTARHAVTRPLARSVGRRTSGGRRGEEELFDGYAARAAWSAGELRALAIALDALAASQRRPLFAAEPPPSLSDPALADPMRERPMRYAPDRISWSSAGADMGPSEIRADDPGWLEPGASATRR